ncbi:MAG: TetR/AcrR family transcriptional regulator [Mycobacterium sp.]|nr:TetR/AcrR family transcriptional regulator [Mycobacterium sp.]
MATRRRTASDQVSAAVLAAAETVLDRGGADAVTVRAVASEAQVAPMSVYNHFASKKGLLDALAIRAFDELASAIAVAITRSPQNRLRLACHGYRDFALAHPARYTLIFSAGSPAAEPASPVHQRGRKVFDTLVDMVRDVAPSSEHPAVELGQAVWSALHGAVSLELNALNQTAHPDPSFDVLIDMALRGITAS